MRIDIKTEQGTKSIRLLIKGRYTEKLWNQLKKLNSNPEDLDVICEYRDLLNDIACKSSGMTEEEINDLEIDEKIKITQAIQDKVLEETGFLKPSLKSVDSLQKITQKSSSVSSSEEGHGTSGETK